MRNSPRILLFLIITLTILSIFIDIPQDTPVPFRKQLFFPTLSDIVRPFGIQKDLRFRKGLDLEGGTSITLKADMKGIEPSQESAALESAKEVIERRVNFLGVSEPVVQTATGKGDYRIIVELPGITDINQAVNLVGTTAKLEFREVISATPSALINYEEDTKPIGLTGSDLKDAQASFDQQNGAPVVLFRVASNSQTKFFNATQKLISKRMAICLDRQCFSAPVVQQAIRDNGQITGGFTIEQARQLATQLNAGALPVSLSILQQRTIGPTLGATSLQKSLFAAVLGFFVIVIFMCVLYGKLGSIASLALILYTLFVLALFKLIPVTITLAGVAGFVLSIGMAVDANILIFERMKEEARRGKPKEVALELGFSRAWNSIKDSNVSSIITSLVLIYFGTGIVRGFAVTLLIGVLVSMFSAIVVTRTFLRMIYR